MATHKQAVKRHRQSLKRRARNNSVESNLRHEIKTQRQAIDKKDKKEAPALLSKTISALDRAAAKGIIPKKRASRQIARLSAAVHRLAAPAAKSK